jgi:small GTP-binding protein
MEVNINNNNNINYIYCNQNLNDLETLENHLMNLDVSNDQPEILKENFITHKIDAKNLSLISWSKLQNLIENIVNKFNSCHYELRIYNTTELDENVQQILINIKNISKSLNFLCEIIKTKQGIFGIFFEFFIKNNKLNYDNNNINTKNEVKLGAFGEESSGKSTTLSVLVNNKLDDGKGEMRRLNFRFQHEIQTGKTLSINQLVLNDNNNNKIINLYDMGGCEKAMKNTLSLVSPDYLDYALLFVDIKNGVTENTKILYTLNKSIHIPIIIVITMIDLIDSINEKIINENNQNSIDNNNNNNNNIFNNNNNNKNSIFGENLFKNSNLFSNNNNNNIFNNNNNIFNNNIKEKLTIDKIIDNVVNSLKINDSNTYYDNFSPSNKKYIPLLIQSQIGIETYIKNLSNNNSNEIYIPIIYISNVEGKNIFLLKNLLLQLPNTLSRHIPLINNNFEDNGFNFISNPQSQFDVHEHFIVNNQTIIGGIVSKGKIIKGNEYYFGPNKLGNFKLVYVESIHCKKKSVNVAYEGQFTSLFLKGKNFNAENDVQKGMCLLGDNNNNNNYEIPKAVFKFKADVWNIFDEVKEVKYKYEPVVIINHIRQTCKIIKNVNNNNNFNVNSNNNNVNQSYNSVSNNTTNSSVVTGELDFNDEDVGMRKKKKRIKFKGEETFFLCKNEKIELMFQFKNSPEYVTEGSNVIINDSNIKAFGIITKVFYNKN